MEDQIDTRHSDYLCSVKKKAAQVSLDLQKIDCLMSRACHMGVSLIISELLTCNEIRSVLHTTWWALHV